MKKILMLMALLLPSVAWSQSENAGHEVYLAASSFDTFFYVDRSSVRSDGGFKAFNLTYVQNGYRGLVVSHIVARADCATPYRLQLQEETVYQKYPNSAATTDFVLKPVAYFTQFPASEVVKDNNTIDAGEYGFWGQTWTTVCKNQWKGKRHLGDATVKLTVLDARTISKGEIKDSVVQKAKNTMWVYRATTPPGEINL